MHRLKEKEECQSRGEIIEKDKPIFAARDRNRDQLPFVTIKMNTASIDRQT